MTGHGRIAFCGALATLAAACTLLPLVHPAVWLAQAAGLVAAQALVGVLARRLPLAGPFTVGLQVLVSLLLLTVFFAGDRAVAGLLPGPDAFQELGRLVNQGSRDAGRYATPAPSTDGLRLMLVGGVLLIGLLVDVLAVTCRSAASAGLPLLALFSVAAGLGDEGARPLWFLCAGAGYLLLLVAEGREQAFRWGRLFTDRGRPSTRTGGLRGRVAALWSGGRIGVVALGVAVLVPSVLPSLDGGLLTGRDGESAAERNRGGTVSAVNPLVALQDSLNQPEDRTALTYTTDAESTDDMYLRIVALDEFDGAAWKPSERSIEAVPRQLPPPAGLSPKVETEKVFSSVTTAGWYAQNWLPLPYPASKVLIDGRWRYEPEGRTLVGDRGQTTRGARYQVESLQVRPTAARLGRAPQPSRGLQQYTKVPESLPPVVRKTALRVTRGASNDYERALKLQEWFTSDDRFQYDTRVRAGSGSAAIANFLEQKEGFCVHFSFSMAAMARTLGLPARVAVGFTPGTEQADGRMAVGLKDAHAWPELYFEGVGWTRFEPTPTRGSAPAYAQPDLPAPDGNENTGEQPESNGRPAPEPQPGDEDVCTAEEKRLDPECGAAPRPEDGGGEGAPAGAVAAISLAALLVLGVPALPVLWRLRARRRRLAGAGGTDSVLSAWRELGDTAWDLGIVPEGSATPRVAAARIARVGELDAEASAALHRVALAVEQVLYAPRPSPATGVPEDVRVVNEGLRQASPRALRIRARMLPRSAVRVAWGATARCTALRSRVTRWAEERRSAR